MRLRFYSLILVSYSSENELAMNTYRTNKTYVNLVKISTLAVGVAAGILSVTYSRFELESKRAVAQTTSRQPNIVVIMTDDMSTRELFAAGEKGWMPNLETHIKNRGTNFIRSFVTLSWCCPSRATFLTGQYPHNHRVLDLDPPDGGVTRLKDSSTLATWLKRAGYRTSLAGKYLNGYGEDQVAGDPSDNPTYVPPGWDDWQAIAKQGNFSYTINDNGTLVRYGTAPKEYQTDVLAERSSNFINESEAISDRKPFFLVITPFAPHFKATPAPRHSGTASTIRLPRLPSFNEQDISDKPAWLQRRKPQQLSSEKIADIQRNYQNKLESLRAVDDLIGKVVSTLKRNGELENTVLMFTSDNGFMFGEHRLTQKTHIYEQSIRVPLLIRAPGFPKQSTSHFVLNNDLAPTIADFAGATPNIPVDGRSLIPLLREPNRANWRKRFLVELYKGVGTTGNPGYFAIRTSPRDTATPTQVYVKYSAGDEEFYDLARDPYQLQSLHKARGRHQQQMQILQNRLADLKECRGKTCRILESN